MLHNQVQETNMEQIIISTALILGTLAAVNFKALIPAPVKKNIKK